MSFINGYKGRLEGLITLVLDQTYTHNHTVWFLLIPEGSSREPYSPTTTCNKDVCETYTKYRKTLNFNILIAGVHLLHNASDLTKLARNII